MNPKFQNMVQSCSAINCSSRYRKSANVSMHRFPTDVKKRKNWLKAMQREHFIPSEYSRICSLHFRTCDYKIRSDGIKCLKFNAIPSVFSFNNNIGATSESINEHHSSSSSLMNVNNSAACMMDIKFLNLVESCSAINCSSTYKRNANVSMHRFPTDLKKRKNWLKAMRREDFTPSEYSRVCSNHFLANDYYKIRPEGVKCLKLNAIPSVFSFTKNIETKPESHSSSPLMNNFDANGSGNTDPIIIDITENAQASPLDLSVKPVKSPSSSKEPYRKRRNPYPVYFGEFSYEDLICPIKRRRYWTKVNELRISYSLKHAQQQAIINNLQKKLSILTTVYGINLVNL